MKSIVLPAGTEHVLFGELAHLIADALWPDAGENDERMAYGAARMNLDGELAQAVKTEALAVKDPLTLGPHTFPIGDALNRALVSVDDLREFVSGRGLSILFQFTDSEAGTTSTSNMTQAEHDEQQQDKRIRQDKGYYTMSEVAQILADTYRLDAAALLKRMKADYQAGNLTIRARDTEAPVLQNHTLRDFYDWMFPDDIRAMLKLWKWNREFPFSALDAEPAREAATLSSAVADRTAIDFALVATRQQLINAFGSFTGMDDSWFTNLKDTPKLKGARRVAGSGGKDSTEPLFCPYAVMLWLIDPKRKKGRHLSEETGWRMLKTHFNSAYTVFAVGRDSTD